MFLAGSDLLSILFFVCLAVVASIVARRKQRNWMAWGTLTLVLGPFALIPLLLQKSLITAPEPIFSENELQNALEEYKLISKEVEKGQIEETFGYVYVVSNPALSDGLIKIGYTERDPAVRLRELDQAGLPMEFIEHYRIRTLNASALEKKLHNHFESRRLRDDKEFFTVPPHEVYAVIMKWGAKPLEI